MSEISKFDECKIISGKDCKHRKIEGTRHNIPIS